MTNPIDDRWNIFDGLGSDQVRKNIASGVYGEDNSKAARAWLEAVAARTVAASQAEANSIASAARVAAERAAAAAEAASEAALRQASAAEKANTRATIAIIISALSIATTVGIAIISFQSIHSSHP